MEGYLYLVLSNQTRKPKFQIAEHFFNSDNTFHAGAYEIDAGKVLSKKWPLITYAQSIQSSQSWIVEFSLRA
ncbi:MAG: hypothetical protein IPG01_15680 [Chitinophagaceae bacterium]|nr:hypothetical protein [Chitinophagaceae bacterium]